MAVTDELFRRPAFEKRQNLSGPEGIETECVCANTVAGITACHEESRCSEAVRRAMRSCVKTAVSECVAKAQHRIVADRLLIEKFQRIPG